MSYVREILKVSVLIGFGWAGVSEADPLPLGGETGVNTTSAGDQVLPKTCTGSSSRVVVWQGPKPGAGEDIFAQLYDGVGDPVGFEFTINATTAGDQVQPDVACRDDGSFVVVWKGQESAAPLLNRIYARRFTSAGAPSPPTGEILVDQVPGEKTAPALAYSGSGEFLVVWQALDGSMDGIFGRAFDTNGSPLTNEIQINTTSFGDQQDPAVALIATPYQAFAVVWEGGVTADIFLQRVRRIGGNLVLDGDEVTVNSGTLPGIQENPDVAVSRISGGQFKRNRIIVVWQGPDGMLDRVWFRLFTTVENSVTTEAVVDTDLLAGPQTQPSVSMPDVAPDLETQAIITWSQEAGAGANGVPVLIVGARRPRSVVSGLWGEPENSEFVISQADASASNSDVALQPDGDFVVALQKVQSDMTQGISGRFYEANWPPMFVDGFESGDTNGWQ